MRPLSRISPLPRANPPSRGPSPARPASPFRVRFAALARRGAWLALALATAGPATAAVWYVDVAGGADGSGCGVSPASPCKNIQKAVNASATLDEIRVATGTYAYQASLEACSTIGNTAVVCILNKQLTIRGGFSASDWTTPNPVANPTTIDGANARRGILVEKTDGTAPTTALTLENFHVRNGKAQIPTLGAGDALIFAFGGGLLADTAKTVLVNVAFENNQAIGANTGSSYGGAGSGGGAALRACPSGTSLDTVTFTNNLAKGGSGANSGGYGIGGGLFTYHTTLTATHLTFSGNTATGGNTAGAGTATNGQRGDGQGAAVAFQDGTQATVDHLTAISNVTTGGNANASAGSNGGGAFGGCVYLEGKSDQISALTLSDSAIYGCSAIGGDSYNGGYARGGGVMVNDASLTLERSFVVDNQSVGGDGNAGGGMRGSGDGGGLTIARDTNFAVTVTLRNDVIADNLTDMGTGHTVSGGGGGGLFLQGLTATVTHSTFARNAIGANMLGEAVVLIPFAALNTTANFDYSIFADHTVPASGEAIATQPSQTANFSQGLFAGNADDTNAGEGGNGVFNGLGSMASAASADFLAPGPPDFDYHLLDSSPAIDLALASAESLDVDGLARSGTRDAGADELGLPATIFADGFETGNLVAWDASG